MRVKVYVHTYVLVPVLQVSVYTSSICCILCSNGDIECVVFRESQEEMAYLVYMAFQVGTGGEVYPEIG